MEGLRLTDVEHFHDLHWPIPLQLHALLNTRIDDTVEQLNTIGIREKRALVMWTVYRFDVPLLLEMIM